jgi:hypothetical protein
MAPISGRGSGERIGTVGKVGFKADVLLNSEVINNPLNRLNTSENTAVAAAETCRLILAQPTGQSFVRTVPSARL